MPASAQYSVTVRVELDARQEPLGKLTAAIAEAGGALQSVDLVPGAGAEGKRVRSFTIDARSSDHWEQILRAMGSTRGARVIDFTDRTFDMHRKGKIELHNKYPLKTRDDLSMAYTPGVARVCEYIAEDRSKAFEFTIKANTVAVVSDGSAVLGLGDIGPEAAMPVMEGKAMLFKEFAGVDAFPICLDTNDPEEIIQATKMIAPTFGGINLEDISAPRCFDIEERLKQELDIPVFHDDQHGTAVVVMAALFNSLKIVGKPIEDLRVLFLGLGAAGVACTKMMQAAGVTHIVGCDRRGAISTEREDYVSGEMTGIKRWYAENSNPDKVSGDPNHAIEGMDLFVGLSGPGLLEADSLGKMNDDAIVFAMANPTPEVMPEDAEPYVRIMATGRSDYPNQINNVLCFPGVFRGALDAGAPHITEEMKLAAAHGIAGVVTEDDLTEDYVIPSVFNRDVAPAVAKAVVEEAREAGIARFSPETGTFATVDGDGPSDYAMTAANGDQPPTLYEWAGGAEAIGRMIDAFYDRVERDEVLSPFFPGGVSREHREHVAAWWCEVLGGPDEYTRDLGGYEQMVSKHRGLEISDDQRLRFATLMSVAADDAKLPGDPEFRAALIGYLEWGTRLAMHNSQPGAEVPAQAPVPRWGWGEAPPYTP